MSTTPKPGGAARQIFLLAANDVRLTLKDRTSFLWMLLLPIGMMWLFGQMGTGGGGTPQISLGVEDRDGGWLAQALVEELAGDQVALTELTVGEAESPGSEAEAGSEGDERPVRVLVIPKGFTSRALAGEAQELRLEVDPDADAAFGMGAQVHIQRSIVRVLGRLLETWRSERRRSQRRLRVATEPSPPSLRRSPSRFRPPVAAERYRAVMPRVCRAS